MSSALSCAPAIEAAMERANTTKAQGLLVPENNFLRWAKAVPLVFKNFTPFPRPRSQCYTSPVKRSYREFHEQWVSLNFLDRDNQGQNSNWPATIGNGSV